MKTKLFGVIAAIALGVLSVGAANADTYDVAGTFTNGASFTGTIDVDNGELLAVDLNADGVIPGGTATFWNGTVTCDQTSRAPSLTSYEYIVGASVVSETYNASTLTYDFYFNGGGALAYLDLDFTLNPSGDFGVITSGEVWDPACIPGEGGCPIQAGGVYLTGGSLSTTPLPGALPLFAAGVGLIGLFGWRRKRKGYRTSCRIGWGR